MLVRAVSKDLIEKRLSPRERALPEAMRRLAHEGALLRALAGGPSPRLVGEGADAEGPYLHIERIPYPTLAERLDALDALDAKKTALDSAWTSRATRAAFEALATLHEAADERGPLATVHADLSPANVIVDDAGDRAWLIDLELACSRESGASDRRDGAFRGTARYCAPEVAREETPSIASDLFALAATMLHALAGSAPRDAPSLPALLAVAAEQPILDSPRLANVTVPPALAACLAHDPQDRPRSARAVLASLSLGATRCAEPE